MSNRLPTKIDHVPRREIHGQLLAKLEKNKDQVAIVCTCEDLRMLIDALRGDSAKYGTLALEFADDAEKLYKGVFK